MIRDKGLYRGGDEEEPLVEEEGTSRPPSGAKRILVVEPLIMLYMCSKFPMNNLISQFIVTKVAADMGIVYNNISKSAGCTVNRTDPAYVTREAIEAEAALWNMYKTLAIFLPSIISPMIMGSLADKLGRRLLFILPCIGTILGAGIYMAIVRLELPIYWILFASVEYLFGGNAAVFAGAFAYTADTVAPNKRAFRMTILDAIALGNGAIADLFVGYWIRAQGFFWPLVFVAGGNFLALLYAIFLVPETVQSHGSAQQRKVTCKDMVAATKLCLYDNGSGRRWKINILLFSYLFAELLDTRHLLTQYEMNAPLCWASVRIGYFNFGLLAIQCVTMLIMSKTPNHWLPPEWRIILSRASNIASNILIAFAFTSLMMYFAPVLGCLTFLAVPMTRYMLSLMVAKNEQASVFSMMSGLGELGKFSSSMSTNKIYKETLYFLHGSLVFFLSAAVTSISLLLMLLYVYRTRRQPQLQMRSTTSEPVGNIQE